MGEKVYLEEMDIFSTVVCRQMKDESEKQREEKSQQNQEK